MAFSTILIIVLVVYVFIYAGMIAYDLFIKKDPTDLVPKQEDEDVDISDEVGQFKPILIEKDDNNGSQKKVPVVKPISEDKDKDKTNDQQAKDTPKDNDTERKDSPPMVTTFDDDVANRKSLSDTGPKEADSSRKKLIAELVALKRQELLAEQMQVEAEFERAKELQTEKEDVKEASIQPTKAHPKSETSKQESSKTVTQAQTTETKEKPTSKETSKSTPTASPKPKSEESTVQESTASQPAQAQPKGTFERTDTNDKDTSRPKKEKAEQPRSRIARPPEQMIVKPEKPRPEPVSYKFLSVDIDEDARPTRHCGAKKAETVQEEAKDLTLEEIRKRNEKFGNLLKLKKNVRQPDEDELEAIELAKKQNRPDPVSFRGAT